MNKSLELIKSEIYEAKSNLQKFTDLLKKESENEVYSFYVRYFTNRLTILQQIKSELEYWEAVKVKILITDGGVIHMAIEEDDAEYETVIKALEVKE